MALRGPKQWRNALFGLGLLLLASLLIYFGDLPAPDVSDLLPDRVEIPDEENAWLPLEKALKESERIYSREAARGGDGLGSFDAPSISVEYGRASFESNRLQVVAVSNHVLMALVEDAMGRPGFLMPPLKPDDDSFWSEMDRVRTPAVLTLGARGSVDAWLPRLRFTRLLLDAEGDGALGCAALMLLETSRVVTEHPEDSARILEELLLFPASEHLYPHILRKRFARSKQFLGAYDLILRHFTMMGRSFPVPHLNDVTRWTLPWKMKVNVSVRQMADAYREEQSGSPLLVVQRKRTDKKRKPWLGFNEVGDRVLSFSSSFPLGQFADFTAAWQGAVLTAALAEFRNQEGRLPETLDELVPGILNERPKEPYTGKSWKLSEGRNSVWIEFLPVRDRFATPPLRQGRE